MKGMKAQEEENLLGRKRLPLPEGLKAQMGVKKGGREVRFQPPPADHEHQKNKGGTATRRVERGYEKNEWD